MNVTLLIVVAVFGAFELDTRYIVYVPNGQ